MNTRLSPFARSGAVLVLVAVLLGGQWAGDFAMGSSGDQTGRALGRAGFAYISGLRTFAAAVLWNRIEPLFHEYYQGMPLSEQDEFIPTMALVMALDPDFDQAYYVSAWILARRGLVDQGVKVARLGVERNPDSGLLRTGYSQVLYFSAQDVDGALEQADAVLDGATWNDLFEQHDAYAYMRSLYDAVGQTDKADYLRGEIERLDEELGDRLPEGLHDHDGDGVPDE